MRRGFMQWRRSINDTMMKQHETGLLSYLSLLTTVFFLFEIFFAFDFNQLYFGDYHLVATYFHVPWRVFTGISFFIIAQIFLHSIFTLFIWILARLVGITLSLSWKNTQTLGFNLWGLGILYVMLANQCFIPHSTFSILFSALIHPSIAKIFFLIFSVTLGIIIFLAVEGLYKIIRWKWMLAIVGSAILTTGFAMHRSAAHVSEKNTPAKKPNVILIGIDALRPDFLHYSHSPYSVPTPHLDHFLQHSTFFSNAWTPLARTFPAWVSILTGEYPKQNGVRSNLLDISDMKFNQTLPAILQRQGYETIFSTDETRFSNIDSRFYFDEVITPPIGFNDFLIGTLNDFPFSNLIANTTIGHYLFPYSYANRSVFVTYDPNTFLHLLEPVLQKTHPKPVFLAVHFCLPHLPYLWKSGVDHHDLRKNYASAVQRADQQVGDFLSLLKQNHLLDNTIVILLSDHGEALELHGDRITEAPLFISKNKNAIPPRFYPPSFDSETIDQSVGHGTDVLGLSQYHIVLAARIYSAEKMPAEIISKKMSLLDIKPMVLTFLHQVSKKSVDANTIKSIVGNSPEKDFFMESDYSPAAILTVHPDIHKILLEGIRGYRLDPTSMRVILKKDRYDLILSSKQYADLYGDWILALYPQNKKGMIPILVNVRTKQWTDDLSVPFARQSPANHMRLALKHFYGT